MPTYRWHLQYCMEGSGQGCAHWESMPATVLHRPGVLLYELLASDRYSALPQHARRSWRVWFGAELKLPHGHVRSHRVPNWLLGYACNAVLILCEVLHVMILSWLRHRSTLANSKHSYGRVPLKGGQWHAIASEGMEQGMQQRMERGMEWGMERNDVSLTPYK